MDRLKFEGGTLGHRHRNYNILFNEIGAKQSADILTHIDPNLDDIQNLFKVDVASKAKNVEYILKVLKGNDMLCVSRAIKQSPWLIAEEQYAHIINPEHLHSQLFPLMMAKAANKLMLSIRLQLRDETRVESFFEYYENLNLTAALKWLPQCSPAFIEIKYEKYSSDINTVLLKRLCEKNHKVLKLCINRNSDHRYLVMQSFQATIFLLYTHTDFYLDLVESTDKHAFPKFSSKCTHFIMKSCPERVYKHFDKYFTRIDTSTFVKYLTPSDIGDFLLQKAINENGYDIGWLNYENIQHFIRRMPLVQRYEFVTEVFIKKKNEHNKGKAELYRSVTNNSYYFTEAFYWHQFTKFDDALKEMKETKSAHDKKEMLNCLVEIVSRDTQRIQDLLQYYHENHNGDECRQKCDFITSLCNRTNVLKYDTSNWKLLEEILNQTCIFKEECSECFDFDDDNQISVQVVIIHKILNNEEVPEVILNKLYFKVTKKCLRHLNSDDKQKLFDYLYNHLLLKAQNINFADLTLFDSNVALINSMFKLLKSCDKNLGDYTSFWNKILDLIKIKSDELSWIYNVNKSWRKCMFEESIVLCPSEKTCMNALKHDPSLLLRNEKEVSAMRSNDKVSLKQLLRKIKIYWPQSLAFEWAQVYRRRLDEPPLAHKSLTRGLSFVLPHNELIKIIEHYTPSNPKISWDKDEEAVISLRRHIAKNMHLARPQPDPSMILLYAKGDYLQFALGSLNAIFYNLSAVRSREFVPRMLDAPVSLQKHGIRLAFTKMQRDDLIQTLSHHWRATKNVSIHTIMFKLTYKLLCKEKNTTMLEKIWSLMNIFIETLTFKEDKVVYELLSKIETVPLQVRPFYLMKSYKFLKSLLSNVDIDASKQKVKQSLNRLIYDMIELVTLLEPEFIEDIIKDYVTAVYIKEKTHDFIPEEIIPLMVSYVLFTESEDIQIQRYETVLLPFLTNNFAIWSQNKKDSIEKTKLKQLLTSLRVNLAEVVRKKMNVPVRVYVDIQHQLDELLTGTENYQISREWKLTVAFANILNKLAVNHSLYEDDKLWDAVCVQAAPEFSNVCVELLKEDINTFFPSIYEHFSKALNTVLVNVRSKQFEIEVLSHILREDLTQTYLLTILLLPNDSDENFKKLRQVLLSHPSLEVKMHFHSKHKHIHGYRI